MASEVDIGSPSESSSRLGSMFKGRRGRKGKPESATNSIASNDTGADGTSGLRASLEGVVDKLNRVRDDARASTDSGRRKSISGLLNGNKKQRKKSNNDGSSAGDVGENSMLDLANTNPSEESLGLHKSEASSLLTEDEETEPKPVRPSLSPHQSHAGYLTLSSPLIASETIDSTSSSLALSQDTSPVDDTLAPRHAATLDAPPSSRKRSPSPVGKLKEAFVPTRRATAPKPGPDTESVKSSGSGGSSLGSLFGGAGKKGNTASRRGSKTLEEAPDIKITSEKGASTPKSSSTPQRINTTIPATPPNLVDAPTTLVTPPTPTDPRPSIIVASPETFSDSASRKASPNPNIVTSPSGNMISHRRVRSATNPPSKLSNSITPLTPTVEEAKTPGGSLTTPNPSGGFFSSVFSAAQNAANSLSTTIANTSIGPGQRNRSATLPTASEQDKTGDAGGEEVIGPETADVSVDSETEKRQLAVETLGSGNLSLSHLGISDNSSEASPMTSKVNSSEQNASHSKNEQASARIEDDAAAQAISAAYSADKTPNAGKSERPRSVNSFTDAQSPPPPIPDDSPVIQRTGSIRSRISGRKRRHRGSSATTGNTIAAAIGASTNTLVNIGGNTPTNGPKLTGFAVASSKRNRDFHQLFRSVPEDDYLIEDYSAALQRDILLQGRLYISEGHICFSSNILGWVTNLVISFDEVVSVEKKSTAVIFPNAIVIQTLHARNVFASLVSRDSTYDLIIGIWKISHPNLKSSLNGVTLDGSGTGDKTEKAESIVSDDASIDASEEEVYDEDAEADEGMSFTEAGDGSIADSDVAEVVKSVSRKASAAAMAAAVAGGSSKILDNLDAANAGAASAQDFPGPAQHGPTECGDETNHYDKLLTDTAIPAPLGKIYSLMFGPASGAFMRKWLIDDQKSQDLQMEDDKKGLGEEKKTFSYSFIKPLNASIGPKQTKCIINQSLDQFDLEKAVTVTCSTQNPDVPSGNIFVVKTRYCLMWAPNNSTRLIMNCTIEWSGKSWLKGPIEKGANEGQTQYAKDLIAALRAAVVSKATLKPTARGRGRGRKKKDAIDAAEAEAAITAGAAERGAAPKEAKHGLLDIVGGLANAPTAIAILCLLVVYLYIFRGPGSAGGAGGVGYGYHALTPPQRLAAYEEMWRREESELWKWLEDRVALDRAAPLRVQDDASWKKRQRAKGMQERLKEESMSERQMEEAIKVTEEKLEALKVAVERRKDHSAGDPVAGKHGGPGSEL